MNEQCEWTAKRRCCRGLGALPAAVVPDKLLAAYESRKMIINCLSMNFCYPSSFVTFLTFMLSFTHWFSIAGLSAPSTTRGPWSAPSLQISLRQTVRTRYYHFSNSLWGTFMRIDVDPARGSDADPFYLIL